MTKNKRFLPVLCTVCLLSAASGGVYTLLTGRPFQAERATYLYIDADDTADSVYVKLTEQLHASSLTGFKMLAALYGYPRQIRPGAYRADASVRTFELFNRLRHGHQTPVRLVVPSVRTTGRMAQVLGRKLMADSTAIATQLADSAFIARLGFDRQTLPALFLPNTYEVYWTLSPAELLQRMKREYDRYWTDERKELARQIGLTPIEVATLASIVEEETAKKDEKPMIAGLYLNRLHKGMLLQADPTVKFGLQAFGLKRILHTHLQTDTPYNTYLHTGLPPGPIRIPSIEGLESVLHYARHPYIYMCAKEDFSGYHHFATTWAEHTANARRYQQALNRRRIK